MRVFDTYGSSIDAQPSIAADLPASIEVTPLDLMEQALADVERELPQPGIDQDIEVSAANAKMLGTWHSGSLLPLCGAISARRTLSAAESFQDLFVLSSLAAHASQSPVTNLWVVAAERLAGRFEDLGELMPATLDDATSPPEPDPQKVDAAWLDSLSTVVSNESDDLYSWYASMNEE